MSLPAAAGREWQVTTAVITRLGDSAARVPLTVGAAEWRFRPRVAKGNSAGTGSMWRMIMRSLTRSRPLHLPGRPSDQLGLTF